jgi:hypothetical protein
MAAPKKTAAPETKPYRVRAWVQGLRDGKPWPQRGEVIDLPDDEAADYLALGYVEFTDEEPIEPVLDVATPAETTAPAPAEVTQPAPTEITSPAPAETPAQVAATPTDAAAASTDSAPAVEAPAPTNTPKVAVKKTAAAAK